MSAHTKGPWAWSKNGASDEKTVCIDISPVLEDYEYRGAVAHLQSCEHIGGITMAETEANANLISAAPDLLKALQEAVAVIEAIKPPSYGMGTIVRGKSAIAKALGEQP